MVSPGSLCRLKEFDQFWHPDSVKSLCWGNVKELLILTLNSFAVMKYTLFPIKKKEKIDFSPSSLWVGKLNGTFENKQSFIRN